MALVVGPRQAGKTTPAAARADPAGFVRGLKSAMIDEVQRAPDLLLSIKESVDKDQAPGRFLLTGSSNLMALPVVADSLAGRLAASHCCPLPKPSWQVRRGICWTAWSMATRCPQRQLQAAVGDKFVHGLVLHDHDRITPFDEKLHTVPVSMLWEASGGLPQKAAPP